MAETFQVSGGLGKIKALMADFDKDSRAMIAQGLNDLAFAWRENAPKVLASKRIIRSASFVRSRFYVQKTQAMPISRMFAQAGSITSERFTGWVEDYQGPASKGRGTRGIGPAARGGDMSGKVASKNRLMPGIDYPKPDDFSDIRGNQNQKIAAMISIIARHPSVAPNGFILYGGKYKPGLYRIDAKARAFLGKKNKGGSITKAILYAPPVQRIQTFVTKKKMTRFDWAHAAQDLTMASSVAIWAKAFGNHFEK